MYWKELKQNQIHTWLVIQALHVFPTIKIINFELIKMLATCVEISQYIACQLNNFWHFITFYDTCCFWLFMKHKLFNNREWGIKLNTQQFLQSVKPKSFPITYKTSPNTKKVGILSNVSVQSYIDWDAPQRRTSTCPDKCDLWGSRFLSGMDALSCGRVHEFHI